MDSEYLKNNIGDVLANGLAAVTLADPHDPIDHLSQWLLKYIETVENEQNISKNLKSLEGEELRVQNVKNESDMIATKIKSLIQARQEQDESFASCGIEETINLSEVKQRFVSLVQNRVEASGVYIANILKAESDDDNEVKRFVYTNVTPGHEFLHYNTLEPGQGVSIRAIQSHLTSDEGNDENDVKSPPYTPGVYFVHNVLLDKNASEVHFFGQKDMGSFAAIHLQYKSLMHEEALKLKDDEFTLPIPNKNDDVNQEDNGDPSVQGENDETDQQNEKIGTDDTQEEINEETSGENNDVNLPEPPRIECDLLIGIDTVGVNTFLTQSQIAEIKRLALILRDVLSYVDMKTFISERNHRAKVSEAQIQEESRSEDNIASETSEAKEEIGIDSSLSNERVTFLLAKRSISSMSDLIAAISELQLPTGPSVVYAALLQLLGIQYNHLSPPHLHVNASCVEAMLALDPNEETLPDEEVNEKISSLDAEAVKTESFLSSSILSYIQAAIVLAKASREAKTSASEANDDNSDAVNNEASVEVT